MFDVLSRTVDGLHPAAHGAAKDLTHRFREYAGKRGVPAGLVPHLGVTWNERTHQFDLGVTDPKHQKAYDDLEYGDLETGRPLAFARGFHRELDRTAQRVYDDHLSRHL